MNHCNLIRNNRIQTYLRNSFLIYLYFPESTNYLLSLYLWSIRNLVFIFWALFVFSEATSKRLASYYVIESPIKISVSHFYILINLSFIHKLFLVFSDDLKYLIKFYYRCLEFHKTLLDELLA